MALAFVQSTHGHSTGFPQSVTTANFGSSPTSGNLIVVGIGVQAGANNVTSVTDTGGNTYVKAVQNNNGSSEDVEIWYAKNITGAANFSVTVNYSSFANAVAIAQEFSGADTVSPLDQTAKNTGSGNGNLDSTNTPTTTAANEIIVGVGAVSTATTGIFTLGTGFSNLDSDGGASNNTTGMESKIVSSTGAYNAAMTSSVTNQNWTMLAATFDDGGGGGPTAPSVSSWAEPVNQPLRKHYVRRQQPQQYGQFFSMIPKTPVSFVKAATVMRVN